MTPPPAVVPRPSPASPSSANATPTPRSSPAANNEPETPAAPPPPPGPPPTEEQLRTIKIDGDCASEENASGIKTRSAKPPAPSKPPHAPPNDMFKEMAKTKLKKTLPKEPREAAPPPPNFKAVLRSAQKRDTKKIVKQE